MLGFVYSTLSAEISHLILTIDCKKLHIALVLKLGYRNQQTFFFKTLPMTRP